ncbi:hypothetical protein D3C78_1197870 [compost metagenome]
MPGRGSKVASAATVCSMPPMASIRYQTPRKATALNTRNIRVSVSTTPSEPEYRVNRV